MLSTTAAYRIVAGDLSRSLALTRANPAVERATEDYLARVGEVKSVEEFLADDRVYRFAMKAFGLEEMTYAKAFVRKVLEGGVDDPDSFANRLADRRYRELAETFNFAAFGRAATAFDATQKGTVDRYLRQTLEETEGARNEGVRLALYFARRAPDLTDPIDVLADPALLRVVQVATGLSPATSAADIDKQGALIAERVDVAELSDPEKLDAFLARFTSLWELQGGGAAQPQVPSVLIGQPRELGISQGLLQSIQSLRIGGR